MSKTTFPIRENSLRYVTNFAHDYILSMEYVNRTRLLMYGYLCRSLDLPGGGVRESARSMTQGTIRILWLCYFRCTLTISLHLSFAPALPSMRRSRGRLWRCTMMQGRFTASA